MFVAAFFLPKKIMRCALGLYFILWEVSINPIVSTSVDTPRVQRQKEALLAFPCNVTRTIRMKTLSAAKLSFDNAFNFVDCIWRCGLLSPPFRRGHIVITLTPEGLCDLSELSSNKSLWSQFNCYLAIKRIVLSSLLLLLQRLPRWVVWQRYK